MLLSLKDSNPFRYDWKTVTPLRCDWKTVTPLRYDWKTVTPLPCDWQTVTPHPLWLADSNAPFNQKTAHTKQYVSFLYLQNRRRKHNVWSFRFNGTCNKTKIKAMTSTLITYGRRLTIVNENEFLTCKLQCIQVNFKWL